MEKNTAHPQGPQYGNERRADSASGIMLPTDFLTYVWDLELLNIGRGPTFSVISVLVGRAQGFAWGLRAADLINEDVLKAMTEAISDAEQQSKARIMESGNTGS